MPSAYGARLTTFEDSEKESECGYVRKAGYAEKMASVWETCAKETSGYAGSCS